MTAADLIDANHYMTIATADGSGRPWVSPVYFAHAEYKEFFWVSKPGAAHSRNLEARPEVSIVIFDSTVPPNTGQAVYMAGVAQELSGPELERGIEIFSSWCRAHDGGEFGLEDVQPPARLRLYRLVVSEYWVLDDEDQRTPVSF